MSPTTLLLSVLPPQKKEKKKLHSIMSPELEQNLLSKQPSFLAWNQLFIPNLEANRKKRKKEGRK
jgi:hypothetical protein